MVAVPSPLTRTIGRVLRGVLSVLLNNARASDLLGGDELRMWVEDVGTGVGKDSLPSNTSLDLFRTFGRAGEDDRGSNAGRRAAAVFFLSTLPGSAFFRGEGRSISLSCSSR